MEGRLWVQSEIHCGSTFHFTVKFEVAEGEVGGQAPVRPAVMQGTRVLVVDDNAANRQILEEVLRSWAMVPVGVPGGEEALKALRDAQTAAPPYRLVPTDAQMPGMSGFGLAERIRDDPELGGTVVMMLTSGAQSDDVTHCEELEITAYLMKPIKQSELMEATLLALGAVLTAAADSAPRAQPRYKPLRPLQILLAEDSLVNQKLAVALLETHGHTVMVVDNGRAAVSAVESQAFDVVLMDVQMPEMDGLAATTAIRSRERVRGGHVPIIGMTAHALKGDRETCLEAGMDEYVAKPIRAELLFTAVDSVLPKLAPSRRLASPLPCGGGVDWSEALQACQDDPILLATIVETALEEIPRLLASIRQALDEGNSVDLRLAAIRLRGPCGTLARRRRSSRPIDLNAWDRKAISVPWPRPCGHSTPRHKR